MDRLEKMADIAMDAALRARAKILEIMGHDYEVQYKADESPVTAADLASQDVLAGVLGEYFPDIPILSEEQAADPYSKRREWKEFWMLDPLDGTKEFVRGNGEFTINVALISNNQPVIGILDWPVGGITYRAVARHGAYRFVDGRAEAIHVRTYHNPCRALISRSHRQAEVDWLKSAGLTVETLEMMGSALKFCRVAEGAVDIYPRMAPNMEWDSAAGQLLIEEAGGKVIDPSGRPLQYNKEDLHNFGYFAVGDWHSWKEHLPK